MSNYKKIAFAVAFLILAGISCWATEKSLHLLLPGDWPEILVWGITVAFFIVASYGTKLIADALNITVYMENRQFKLIGGIVLVLFFWLLMSMPTNTHTFFYRNTIGDVVMNDISTTRNYLTQIIDKGKEKEAGGYEYDAKGIALKKYVDSKKEDIKREFYGESGTGKAGNGEQVGMLLKAINDTLHTNIKQNPNRNSRDPRIYQEYETHISQALISALESHRLVTADVLKKSRKVLKRLGKLYDFVSEDVQKDNLTEDKIKQCQQELQAGYNLVKSGAKVVVFNPDSNDADVYTKENAETKTKRMSSVIDVFFVDFLAGRYPGSFIYYVLLSILVDIAAFLFFDLAFANKKEY